MTSVRFATVSSILPLLVALTLLVGGCGQTPDTITISPDTASLAVGQTQKFSAAAQDTKGRAIEDLEITWSLKGEGGRIDADGTFTALKAGSATIVASTEEVQGSITISITPEPVAKLTTAFAPQTVVAGQPVKLTITALNDAGTGIPDAPVQAKAETDGVDVKPTTATTNASGQATFTITTSPKVQANQITIESGGQTITASVQTQSGPPATVQLLTDSTDITAGSETAVQVLVVDAANNPVPNVTVQLDAGSSGATVTPAQVTTDAEGRASATFKSSTSSGAAQLSATVEGLAAPQGMQFQNQPGAPAQLTLQADPPSMIAAGSVTLLASIQDTHGNGIPGATVQLSVSAPDAALGDTTLTSDASGSAATTLQLGPTPGPVTVEATVQGAPTASLAISSLPAIELRLAPKTVSLDMLGTQAFEATAIDAEGHAITVTPEWKTVGENGVISAEGVFSATGLGTEAILATYADLQDGAQITIVPGEAAAIEMVPAETTVTAGTNFQFQAKVLNAHQHPLDIQPTWEVTNGLGSIDAVGLFTAQTSGEGEVIATVGEFTGRAKLTVTPGALATVKVEPTEVSLTAGEELQLQAKGYDAGGNEVEIGTPSWALAAELGELTPDGIFRARHAGTGEIQVEAGPTPILIGIPVEVLPADLERLEIEPQAITVSAGAEQLFTATGFDAYDNAVDITPVWSLSEDGVGQINEQGSFYARKTGSVNITATVGDHKVEAAATVKPSDLARIVVQPEGPLTLKAGTGVSFTLNGYDAFENAVALKPEWSQSTPLGTISPEGAFRAETVGSGSLLVQQGDIQASVPMTVTKGNLSRISITPSEASLQAGNTIKMQATGFDAYDNEVEITPTWRVTESIGNITEAGEFKALRTQQGEVVATADGVSGSVAVAVEPGPLTMLNVTPAQLNLKGGETAEIIIVGYDEFGNPAPVSPTWRIPEGMGTIDENNQFTAQRSGTGRLIVVAEDLAELIDLSVEVGTLASIAIEPAGIQIASGGEQAFTAQGLDGGGNPIPTEVTWSAQGETAAITAEGVFSATQAGTMQVLATAGEVVGQIDVEILPGPAVSLELPSSVPSLTAGESIPLETKAMDAAGNVITSSPAWTVDGGIGTISEDNVFTATGAGSGSITATMDGHSQTIELSVAAGALTAIGITPENAVIKAGEQQQFSAVGLDAFGNPLPVDVTWSQQGNLGTIDATAGLFEATKAGSGAIVAVSGTIAGVNAITVEPSKLATLQLAPTHTVTTGKGVALLVKAFDTHGNEASPPLQWDMSEPLGEISEGVFWGDKVGTTVVTVRSEDVETQTTITVQLGEIVRLEIPSGPTNPQAGKPVRLQAIGFDAKGNASEVEATWTLEGEIGTLSETGEFKPTTPGSGTLTATVNDLTVSAPVTVDPGPVHRLELTPAQAQVASTMTQTFTISAFDVEGNAIETDVEWALSADIGQMSPDGTLTGTRAGTGTLVAYVGGVIATAHVDVTPGPVAHVFVTPQPIKAEAGEEIAFKVQGFDANHNVIETLQPTWRVSGGIGTIDDATGAFTATLVGHGKVEVQVDDQVGSADLEIHPTSPDAQQSRLVASRLIIPANGRARADIIVYVHDRFGNPITDAQVTLISSRTDKIDQPGLTNQHGIALGHIRSLAPGESTIVAVVESVNLNTPLVLTFKGEDVSG